MKKRFTDQQIIGILKQAEIGIKVAYVLRKHRIGANNAFRNRYPTGSDDRSASR